MGRPRIEVENLKEVQAAIRRLGDAELRTELRKANKSVAQMIVDQALPEVPVRSGKLRQSVKAQATQTSAYGKAGSPARVPYAAAIHWGEGSGNAAFTSGGSVKRANRNIAGRPFLWDAVDRVTRRALKEYEDAIDALITKVVR